MKTVSQLEAIRAKMKQQMDLRQANDHNIRVVVGMATCGIAAGARPVMTAFLEEVAKRNLSNITVSQTGCIGVCRLEPIVEVFVPGQEKVTYVKVKADIHQRRRRIKGGAHNETHSLSYHGLHRHRLRQQRQPRDLGRL